MLIGLEKLNEAYLYFVEYFSENLEKALSADIYVIEAEIELRHHNDHEAAMNILLKVLDEDKLHANAMILLSHILILYEGKYQEGLDYLLKWKMLKWNKKHELWNLLGHAYGFIDGVWDKSEESFTQASMYQLEYPEWLDILDIIPFSV